MSKSQINFRLPDILIAALKDRAESEGLTSTELVIHLLEEGLGLPSSEKVANDESRIEKRIATQLAPLQERLIALETSLGGVKRLREEAESLKQKNKQIPDLEAIRDRVLSGVKLGKQAPEYKRTKALLDRFIDEVRSS